MRNRILSFGDPICCPSVMYCMNNCENFKFDNNFVVCCDWDYMSRIAQQKGSFIYINNPLVGHRIHSQSATTETIENGVRADEEYTMFTRYWSKGFSKKLASVYKNAMKSNKT